MVYADATVALFTMEDELPWRVWILQTSAGQVVGGQWSPIQASVFFVMDSSCVIHVWDLLQSVEGPSYWESLCSKDDNGSGCRSLAFQVSTCNSTSKEHTFAFGENSNHVYVHLMKEVGCQGNPQIEEVCKLFTCYEED